MRTMLKGLILLAAAYAIIGFQMGKVEQGIAVARDPHKHLPNDTTYCYNRVWWPCEWVIGEPIDEGIPTDAAP